MNLLEVSLFINNISYECNEWIKKIINEIKSIHSYDIPEIISIDFNILSDKYEKWFNENTKIDK